MSALVIGVELTFGLVAIIVITMVATLKISKVNVGMIKCELLGLSNLGIIAVKIMEIIIELTESRILALLSAMALSCVWFRSVTRKSVSMPRSGRSSFLSFFSFIS